MKTPDISIIVPAYNAEQWLPVTVDSILAQTCTDWELIIVNDGSTDNTHRVARSYADDRIRVVDQANAGVSAARNTGLSHARGNYIGFLDSDDAFLPDCLAAKLQVLQQSKADWVFSDVVICNEKLEPTGEIMEGIATDILRTLLLQERLAVPVSCGNVLAHRKCFDQGVRFDEQLSNAADQDFSIQLASRFRGVHLPGAYTLYRNVPGSMSKDIELFQEDHLRMFRKADVQELMADQRIRRRCLSNVYWAIGGSWWLFAHKPLRALPWLLRAFMLRPTVIIRPFVKRLAKS